MVGERGEKSSHHRYVRVISSLSLHLWSPSYFIYAMRPFCSHFISPHTESFMCCRATTGNTAEQQRHRLIKLWSTANRCDTIKWTNLPCDTMKFVDIDGESSWQLWIWLFKRFCETLTLFLSVLAQLDGVLMRRFWCFLQKTATSLPSTFIYKPDKLLIAHAYAVNR